MLMLFAPFVAAPTIASAQSDSDMDTISDADESGVDTDEDGANDDADLDSDDDTIADADEAGDDDLSTPPVDSDEDETADFRDLDSDGDTIADAQEAGDDDPSTPPVDSDEDGTADFRDLDSDGDTIADVDEAGDGDRETAPADTDEDGIADYLDEDSDGDGLLDAEEAGDDDPSTPPIDSDRDGLPDAFDSDSDGDGLSDTLESDAGQTRDSDGDGLPDHLDDDADGDGAPDRDEARVMPADLDGDGLPAYRDPDSDGDGVEDGIDVCPAFFSREQEDLDQDGEGDACDDDIDGDTILDEEDNCPRVANSMQEDSDGDGQGDACAFEDADRDGIDDRLSAFGGCAISSGAGASEKNDGGQGPAPWVPWLSLVGFALVMRRRRRRRGSFPMGLLALMLASMVTPAPSLAQEPIQEPQGAAASRARLAMDRAGILGVESGSVPFHLDLQGSLFFGWEEGVANLQGDGARAVDLITRRVSGGVQLYVPLWDTVALGVAMPFVLHQSRPTDQEGVQGPLASLTSAGLTDLRVVPKVQILRRRDDRFALSLMPTFTVPLGAQGDAYLREEGATFRPEIAISGRRGGFRWAANMAYVLRPEARILGATIDDELEGRFGVALDLASLPIAMPMEFAVGVALTVAASDPFANEVQTPLELQVGWTWDVHEFASVFVNGGAALTGGWGLPAGRAMVGVRAGLLHPPEEPCRDLEEDLDGFEDDDGCPDPDNDEDGFEDDQDACPNAAEDVDGFEDTDGCPEPDNDGDGIRDELDQCPLEAESLNDYQDDDGCPDEVPLAIRDPDGDGLEGDADACPTQAEDQDGLIDEDGCPEADADGDGVEDPNDRCPLEDGIIANEGCPDGDGDEDGVVDRLDVCPEEAGRQQWSGCLRRQPLRLSDEGLIPQRPLRFAGARLVASRATLQAIARLLTVHPSRQLAIHVTEAAAPEAGVAEAERARERALAIRTALVNAGAAEARITIHPHVISSEEMDARAATRRGPSIVLRLVLSANLTVDEGGNSPTGSTTDGSGALSTSTDDPPPTEDAPRHE